MEGKDVSRKSSSSSSSSSSSGTSSTLAPPPSPRPSSQLEEEGRNFTFSSTGLSRARLAFMAFSICGAYVVWGLLFSVQPPIYPKEAEDRGAKPSQYGFVFGIAHLAAFLTAPVFAQWGSRIGPKLLYTCGSITESLSGGILFGTLAYVSATGAFLGLSYFLRFLFGMGNAASFGAVLGILVELFPEKVATIMSSCESFFGVGYTIGPAVSSFLYELGGFELPFFVSGSIGIFFAVCLVFALPSKKQRESIAQKRKITASQNVSSSSSLPTSSGDHDLSVLKVARSPSIWIPYVDNVVLQCGYGFAEAMLQPHAMNEAGMTQAEVGAAFLLMGATYMIGSPIVGRLCDKVELPSQLTYFSVAGNASMLLGMLVMGPASFFGSLVVSSRALIFLSTFFLGLAYAFNMVSSFARANKASMELRYKDDINTYLVISGLWTTSFYLGNFVGPTVAGTLVQSMGFRVTTTVFCALYLVMAAGDVVDIIYKITNEKKRKRGDRNANDETARLLD